MQLSVAILFPQTHNQWNFLLTLLKSFCWMNKQLFLSIQAGKRASSKRSDSRWIYIAIYCKINCSKNKKLVNCLTQHLLNMNIIREHGWQEICASNESRDLPSEEVEPIRQRENSDLAWNRLSNGNVRWILVVLKEGLDLILR